MATNEREPNISAWDAMMENVAGLPEIERLRAENERLRAENAAMRPVVEAVAEHVGVYVSEHFRQCAFCGNGAIESRIIAHADDCEVAQARAFLASAGQAAESEGE